MIVVGYQGIGKSSLAGRNYKYIDLESGNFWVDGKRADDWYKPYCQIAEHLSQQGYVVFTSSHQVVRDYLKDSNETIILAYPSIGLKDSWIKKLEQRYQKTNLEKDYKALMNAKDRFEENIRELSEDKIFNHMTLYSMDYDLEAALIHWQNIQGGNF